MKISIDLTALDDNFSGIERYAACLSLELLKSKDINFILFFKNKIHPLFLTVADQTHIEVVIIPGQNKLIFNQLQLPWEMYKYKADWYLFMAFPVPLLFFRKNMVSTIHDICCWDCPETMKGLSKWYFRISHCVALKKCKAIMTISEYSENRIINRLRYRKDKIWRIYCGVDEKFFEHSIYLEKMEVVRKKYNLPEKYILSLSTLEPRKNLTMLIEAYHKAILSGCDLPKLVLAGRKGWKMDSILGQYSDSINDYVHFTGFIEDEDLPAVYRWADWFVFPSKYEGFGIPPLEAMACGTPVLSSDAASLPEVLGDAALFFESENCESLKSRLCSLQTISENEYKSMVTLGVSQAKKYDWYTETCKLQELLNMNNT